MEYTHLGRSGLSVCRLCLGTMNFGPLTSEADAHAIMDSAHELRHQLLRHRQRLRAAARRGRPAGEGTGLDRADHRPLVRPGRRPPGADRAGHQGVRRHGRLAQRGQAVGAEHPPRARRQPEPAADRLHRPLPVPPRRPGHPVGRDLAGHRGRRHRRARSSTSAAATSPAGTSPRPATPRPQRNLFGLVSEQSHLQPDDPATSSSRSSRRRSDYGLGIIPWSPLQGGLLGGVLRKEREGSAGWKAAPPRRSRPTASQIEAYEDFCRRARPRARRRRAGLAAAPAGVTARSSARAPSSSSTPPSAPLDVAPRREGAGQRLDEIFPGYRTAPEHYAW